VLRHGAVNDRDARRWMAASCGVKSRPGQQGIRMAWKYPGETSLKNAWVSAAERGV